VDIRTLAVKSKWVPNGRNAQQEPAASKRKSKLPIAVFKHLKRNVAGLLTTCGGVKV